MSATPAVPVPSPSDDPPAAEAESDPWQPPAGSFPWLAFLPTLLGFAALVWRFDWLCDDAYISFRFARNLARGEGLVFNPGVPVEGYTNFLWVVLAAPFEAFGPIAPIAMRVLSAACALGWFAWLAAWLGRECRDRGAPLLAAGPGLLIAAGTPPLAVWATSGLATFPVALCTFGLFERLFARGGPRAVQAGCLAAAAVLLRADAPVLVAGVCGGALAAGLVSRDRALARAALVAGLIAAGVLLAHTLWRYAYYGAWVPNTARVKVDPSPTVFLRGWHYVVTYALTVPGVVVALVVALARSGDARVRTALSAVLVSVTYTVFVGGDFMAMGRFLIPATALVVAAAGIALAGIGAGSRRRLALAAVLGLASAGLSLPAAWNVSLFPRSLREAFMFRWGAGVYLTEYEQWRMMLAQAELWSVLGGAIARHTTADQSLVHGTIGAVGYHTEVVIHDPYGLINTEPFEETPPDQRATPGHSRRVAFERFFAYEPTWLEAELVPAVQPRWGMREVLQPRGRFADRAKPEWYPVDDVPGVPPNALLRLVRYVPRR